MLNRERSIKIFGDQLIDKVKDKSACKLTDLKVVLGSNQWKALHPTSSTTCIDENEQDIVAIVPKEIHLVWYKPYHIRRNCSISLYVIFHN